MAAGGTETATGAILSATGGLLIFEAASDKPSHERERSSTDSAPRTQNSSGLVLVVSPSAFPFTF